MHITTSKQPHTHSHQQSGFTLLEMVMVMGIIAILAGGAIFMMRGAGDTGGITRADTDIKAIQTALLDYKTKAGRFPTEEQGLEALVEKPTKDPIPKRYKSFFKTLPVDPWGNPYVYREKGSQDDTTYEVLSYGPDKEEGGDDDISSQD